MMICRADFEELFPDLFEPKSQSEPVPSAQQLGKSPSAECIARWEDDGGRTMPKSGNGCPKPVPAPDYGFDIKGLAKAGSIAATMPSAVAYAAARTMLSTYGPMATARTGVA